MEALFHKSVGEAFSNLQILVHSAAHKKAGHACFPVISKREQVDDFPSYYVRAPCALKFADSKRLRPSICEGNLPTVTAHSTSSNSVDE